MNGRGTNLYYFPIVLSILTTGCAARQEFSMGSKSLSQFVSDKAECEGVADAEIARAETQAEALENESDEQIVGAGLGAMLVGAEDGAGIYNKCMRAKGYHQ